MDVRVTTQLEFDVALKAGNRAICASGVFRLVTDSSLMFPEIIVEGGVKLSVVAWGSSQPHVVARGSSQPHVVAWESSQPHVEAWGSSQPHVEAWGSSQPHVEAWGYVQLSIVGRVIATLTAHCSAVIRGITATVTGGHQVRVDLSTPQAWCDYYGVAVTEGVAVLFKALNTDYTASRNRFSYTLSTSGPRLGWRHQ